MFTTSGKVTVGSVLVAASNGTTIGLALCVAGVTVCSGTWNEKQMLK